ncbi:MAG: OmpA family protein [Xanthomonadales bacterium]|nr:OmpA family protein [Xanthomonadales bacterium]
MKSFVTILLACAFLAPLPALAQASDDEPYLDIPTDLASGMLLLDVAERAHDNTGDYYEPVHGHPRNQEHEHGNEAALDPQHFHVETETSPYPDEEVRYDEDLSAYDAVGEIWLHAQEMEGQADPDALDLVKVVIAVIDAWNQCNDTFGAVMRGVELMPERAAEIAAVVGIKKDCNCAAGGLWPQRRVEQRVRAELGYAFIGVPRACSCSQAAMFGAIAGLPENAEFMSIPEEDEEARARVTGVMVERSNEIIERTNAAQNRNDWDCSCTNVNLAASMRGIADEDLREGTWEGLAQKYTDEAGDTGLVVDAFGIVGRYPVYAWGSQDLNSREHILRRQPRIYRGDSLLLDPFDPAHEWVGAGGRDFSGLGSHDYDSVNTPTDLFISEYVIGDRAVPVAAAKPPGLVKTTITLDSEVTFELDKYEIRPEASPVLDHIAEVIGNTNVISEVLIEGHTCDIATDEYNQLLSERRARSVMEYLSGAGLDAENMGTAGFGESRPRFPNDSEENRSRNRRVEITYLTREDIDAEKTVTQQPDGRQVEITFVRPEDQRQWQETVQDSTAVVLPVVDVDEETNRLLEIYNGGDEDIDMGQQQYFLEIYGEEFDDPQPVAVRTPSVSRQTLTLDSDVTFELDKSEIRPEAAQTLQSVAEVINQADIFSEVLITGHTCDLATDQYNQLLSERRARSVREYLEGIGLEVEAIRTEGRGEAEPRLPNISEENRSQNRRVEITFVTRSDREIEKTVTEEGGNRLVTYAWTERGPGVAAASDLRAAFGGEYFVDGERTPREVIGLNGRVEAGGTFIVAYDNSDEELTELADIVTGQLDFLPTDTLVLRRFGGERALACKAQNYAFLFSFPPHIVPIPEPIRPPVDPICIDPALCDDNELGSPN